MLYEAITHQILFQCRCIGDGGFMKNVIKPVIIEKFDQNGRVIDVAADYLTPETDEIFEVSETFQITVAECLTAAKTVEDDHLGVRMLLLKIEGKIGTDKTGPSGNQYGFVA